MPAAGLHTETGIAPGEQSSKGPFMAVLSSHELSGPHQSFGFDSQHGELASHAPRLPSPPPSPATTTMMASTTRRLSTALTPEGRPQQYKLNIYGLLSLPFRLCNPPPVSGKVRSCSVTPIFEVQLDDILARRHLPPLGLKDFEEWLLYVELCPENLYFILWLQDYKQRHREWSSHVLAQSLDPSGHGHRIAWRTAQLTMFYARAKETFLTVNSNYELHLASDILSPFHSLTSNLGPHPDPAVFDRIEVEIRHQLKGSLKRFVAAQFTNVGNNRALCGVIAGFVSFFIGALFPILYMMVGPHRHDFSRWTRLSALPGLWLGLTLLISSMHGICLGVYIFGDLRQLRKFELSRPPISPPKPLPTGLLHRIVAWPHSSSQGPLFPSPASTPSGPPTSSRTRPILHPITIPSPSRSRYSSDTYRSGSSEESYSNSEGVIHISPAYFDEHDVEGPATTTTLPPPELATPVDGAVDTGRERGFGRTAAFIPPYELPQDLEKGHGNSDFNSVPIFDFDTLPAHPTTLRPRPTSPTPSAAAIAPNDNNKTPENDHIDVLYIQAKPNADQGRWDVPGIIRRIQSACNVNRWLLVTEDTKAALAHPFTVFSAPKPSLLLRSTSPSIQSEHQEEEKANDGLSAEEMEERTKRRFKIVQAVPAFSSPLTHVLSPVIVRGQWEIVIRSTLIALLVSWIVLGSLLAVPP